MSPVRPVWVRDQKGRAPELWVEGRTLVVKTAYHPSLIEGFRTLGGRFRARDKAWTFPLEKLAAVSEVLRVAYPDFAPSAEVLKAVRQGGGVVPEDLRQAISNVLATTAYPLLPEQKGDLARIFKAVERSLRDPAAPKGFVLANGTGTGKTYVYSALASAWSLIGDVLVVVPNEELLRQTRKVLEGFGGSGVKLTTYGRLEGFKGFRGLLVLDEAHFVKNLYGRGGSKRARLARELMRQAQFVLFVTATPFDRPWEGAYMAPTYPHRLTGDTSFETFLLRFGVGFRERSNGGREPYFYGTVDDLRAFYHTLTAGGFMSKRLFVPPEGLVSYEAPKLSIPKASMAFLREVRRRLKDVMRLAPPEERGLVASFRENLSRAMLERLKLKESIPLIEGLLLQGWHVALFLAYRQERTLDLSTPKTVAEFLEEKRLTTKGVLAPYVADALSGLTLTLESPVEELKRAFGWLGDGLAFYTGAEGGRTLREVKERWDRGEIRLLVLTQAKGGVGLSLHDTRGGRPTAQVVLTLPWTAIELDQILGRVIRVGMRSPVKVVLPLAPSSIEAKLGGVIAERLKVLGYAVRGGETSLPPEVVAAFEYGLAEVNFERMERLLEEGDSVYPEGGAHF